MIAAYNEEAKRIRSQGGDEPDFKVTSCTTIAEVASPKTDRSSSKATGSSPKIVASTAGLVGAWRGPNGVPFFFHGNDVVAIPDQTGFNLPNGSPWTLEAWIYPTENPRGRHIVGKRDGCKGPGFYQIAVDINAPETGVSVAPQYTPINTWTHVAIVADGRVGWSSYANGELVKTVFAPGWQVQSPGRFVIGGSGTCGIFVGVIGRVSLYQRALSEAEIQVTYSSQRSEVLHDRIEP